MTHNITKCRSCGADIIFITTENGRKMPCDAVFIRKHCTPNAKRTRAACRRQRLYAALGDVSVCK